MNKKALLYLLTSVALTACGGGTGGGEVNSINTPSTNNLTIASPPEITLSISPSQVNLTQDLFIQWHSKNATECIASEAWNGTKPTSGSINFKPTTPGKLNFHITCSGPGGTAQTNETVKAFNSVVAWGASFIAGMGSSNPATKSVTAQLAAITGRSVSAQGIIGQTSSSVAARQGGSPALLSFSNNILLGEGGSLVTSSSAQPLTTVTSLKGEIGGIKGVLSRNENAQVRFFRDSSGASIFLPDKTAFIPDTEIFRSQIAIFWVGRNNPNELIKVISDTRAMANYQLSGKFIVLSIPNSSGEPRGSTDYSTIINLNNALQAAFPDNYLDIRGPLVAYYDPNNAQDLIDFSRDIPPTSLRSDSIHLNDSGYALVAKLIAEFINSKGWD